MPASAISPPAAIPLLAMSPLARLRRRFAGCASGNVALIFALGMPVVAGAAALSVETSYHYLKQDRLQAAVDAAAFAGGLERLRGADQATIRAAATAAATDNGWRAAAGSITVNSPPVAGPNAGATAVEVVLRQSEPRFFSALVSDQPVNLSARAVGLYRVASDACVLALNRNASAAVDVTGSSTMTLLGCDVVTNSVADGALTVWGSAKLKAACAVSAGGVTNKKGLTLTDCPGPITQAPPVADPFKDVPEPTASGGCKNDKATALSPGRYCKGLDIKTAVHLDPGVYFLDGDLRLNAKGVLTGSGVTIFLNGASRVQINGGAHLALSAPLTGPYAGILLFGDRDSTGTGNIINGDASSNLTGNLYFPSQQLSYSGSFSGSGGCTHIVADTIQWSGNASLAVDCSAQAMAAIPGRRLVGLVE